jgi:hypothetical protein
VKAAGTGVKAERLEGWKTNPMLIEQGSGPELKGLTPWQVKTSILTERDTNTWQ